MTTARSHALYRFYDTGGALLYVGITLNPAERWRAHRDEKPWWHEISTITIEVHPTRDTVLDAERAAIINEQPAYNVAHNRGHAPAAVAWGRRAEDMPDDCHDRCARNGILSIYFPHRWDRGLAHYTCTAGHHWTCGWAHPHSGTAPQHYAHPHAQVIPGAAS